LNFVSNQTIPNSVVAPVHPTYGAICLYVYGKADLLVDVSGYLSSEATENSGGSSDSSDDSAGDSLPDPVTDRSRTSVLSTQTEKWSKFEALQPASDRARPRTAVRPQSLEIQFRSVGVVGLALPDQSSSGSGLLAVTAAGQALDALLSGSADIANFYSAPNGRYYVLFNQTVALETGGPLCRLAEVEASTGVPTCVDSDLDTINWNLGSSGYGNTPVQFDDDGDVYYSGSSSNTGKTVLRKFDGTSATDLINDNIDLTDFRVLDDGGVIMTGSTQNTSASWVRRLSAAGALANLATGVQASFIQEFADGNVYVGLWGGDFFGIKQYDTSTGRLKSKYWIGGNVNGIDRDVDNDADQICEVFDLTMGQGFCGNYGTQVSGLYSILGQKSFAIAGGSGQSGTRLMQYYPTVEPANSVISSVTRAQRVITAILIAGVDSDGVNMLTVYDTGSKQETILIDALNEVEIYNMTYVLSTNSVMFNGLRFSDNTYVVGEIDLG
jgi:hypothetical protein